MLLIGHTGCSGRCASAPLVVARRPPVQRLESAGDDEHGRSYRLRAVAPGEAAESERRVEGEDTRERMRRQLHDPTPPLWPMSVTPTNAREKKNGTARLFANTSWPMPKTPLAEWEGIPVAPNAMKRPGANAELEWASCEAMAHAVGVICAVATAAGCPGNGPHGACDDLWKWYRQIPAATASQVRQCFCWGGRMMRDKMLQMGRFASAHVAQRVSFVVTEMVFVEVNALALRWLRSRAADGEYAALQRIVGERCVALGERHAGIVHIEVCQDDLGWAAVCEPIAWIVWLVLPDVLAAVGVRYSEEKRSEQGRPGKRYIYMGVLYRLQPAADPRMFNTDDKRAKWLTVAGKWTERPGQLVPETKLAATLGLGVFMCKAQRRGRTLLNRGFSCMAARSGGMKPVSHGWLTDLAALTATIEANAGVPMLVDPRWWSAGALGIAGDASVSDDEGGYGGNVLRFAFHGVWTAEQRRLLDISALELYTVVFIVVVAATFAGLGGRRIVVRSDNAPTVDAVNRCGSTSPTMEAARKALDAACSAFNVEVMMLHIPGKRNVIADAFSRGAIDEGLRLLRSTVGEEPEICEIPAAWSGGPCMRELLRVARRWRPDGVRRGRQC